MTLELYQLQICPYFDSRVVIYDRKMFIRLDAGANVNSVWPDVKIKSGSIFTKVAQKVNTVVFTYIGSFPNIPKRPKYLG